MIYKYSSGGGDINGNFLIAALFKNARTKDVEVSLMSENVCCHKLLEKPSSNVWKIIHLLLWNIIFDTGGSANACKEEGTHVRHCKIQGIVKVMLQSFITELLRLC